MLIKKPNVTYRKSWHEYRFYLFKSGHEMTQVGIAAKKKKTLCDKEGIPSGTK